MSNSESDAADTNVWTDRTRFSNIVFPFNCHLLGNSSLFDSYPSILPAVLVITSIPSSDHSSGSQRGNLCEPPIVLACKVFFDGPGSLTPIRGKRYECIF